MNRLVVTRSRVFIVDDTGRTIPLRRTRHMVRRATVRIVIQFQLFNVFHPTENYIMGT